MNLIAISMLVALLFSWFGVSHAEKYSVTVDKLNQLEERLNSLESTRKKDIVELEKRLAAVSNIPDFSDMTGSIEELHLQVNKLESEEEVEYLESEEESSGIEISGFCDILYDSESKSFGFGQLEIDLEAEVAENVVVTSAICYDAESGAFGSGALIIDFHLFGSDVSHFRHAKDIYHSGVIIGQFDVPIGIDLNYYPSIDRKLVSGPLVVENTHDGWNDVGVQAYLETEKFNGVLYVVNGFSYDTGVVDAVGDPVMSDVKMSAGGRLGIKPNDIVELGASYASFNNDDNKVDMSLLGVDIQAEFGYLTVKGEYIAHTMGIAGNNKVTNNGLYGQGTYQLDKFFIVGRYGTFVTDDPAEDDLTRITGGVGYVISDGCEIRLEHQINSEDEANLTFLQIVVAF
ncbi:MAG: porin [Calditrichaeota bacterium]|nr:porin [Calditrichota bacterium]